jgi:hypothetical protein
MTQPEIESFLQLYGRYRYNPQLDFYVSRKREFRRARDQALWISIGLIFFAALAGALETITVPWFNLLCLLIAAICPVLSSALTGYNALYAFEQQAKIYGDALVNLQKIQARLGNPRSDADLSAYVIQYVQAIEETLQNERGQWGQLAHNMKPPDL